MREGGKGEMGTGEETVTRGQMELIPRQGDEQTVCIYIQNPLKHAWHMLGGVEEGGRECPSYN